MIVYVPCSVMRMTPPEADLTPLLFSSSATDPYASENT